MQTLHLEVLVLEVGIDRRWVDAPSHIVGALLGHREEGGPHISSVGLIQEGADRADGEIVLQSGLAGLELLGLACRDRAESRGWLIGGGLLVHSRVCRGSGSGHARDLRFVSIDRETAGNDLLSEWCEAQGGVPAA